MAGLVALPSAGVEPVGPVPGGQVVAVESAQLGDLELGFEQDGEQGGVPGVQGAPAGAAVGGAGRNSAVNG